jgi:hypothetical protein
VVGSSALDTGSPDPIKCVELTDKTVSFSRKILVLIVSLCFWFGFFLIGHVSYARFLLYTADTVARNIFAHLEVLFLFVRGASGNSDGFDLGCSCMNFTEQCIIKSTRCSSGIYRMTVDEPWTPDSLLPIRFMEASQ